MNELDAVQVEFNEALFDVNSVRVMFSSNCTKSVIVAYANPVLVAIPDTGLNTGQCHYSIQLVDSISRHIGYPIMGLFVPNGKYLCYMADTNNFEGRGRTVGCGRVYRPPSYNMVYSHRSKP